MLLGGSAWRYRRIDQRCCRRTGDPVDDGPIVRGSTFKGVVAGLIIGFVARRRSRRRDRRRRLW
jgi:hypothetical protein